MSGKVRGSLVNYVIRLQSINFRNRSNLCIDNSINNNTYDTPEREESRDLIRSNTSSSGLKTLISTVVPRSTI